MVNLNHKIDDNHCSPRETIEEAGTKNPTTTIDDTWAGLACYFKKYTINFKLKRLKLDLCSLNSY